MQNADLPIGAVVDGYIVERKIGAGGMGQIYEVREPGTEQRKALKVIASHSTAGQETPRLAEDRFKREAQVLARLTALEHPNIIAIHRYARFGDRQYIVMPLFHGIDLHKWIKTNPDLNRVLHVARQLASAVGYAHSQGILHRDIKPSNALISPDDKVKLIDFGLARDSQTDEHQLTAVGTTSGTRGYLAPEYLRSPDMDHDVLTEMWALGVLLYNLVTHRLPFRAPVGTKDDARATLMVHMKIMDGVYTPVRTVRPDCSQAFAAVIHDLLQLDRNKRIKNAIVLGERLAAVVNAYEPGVPPALPLPEPTPEKDPTRPGRGRAVAPSEPPRARVPEATSSEWSPKDISAPPSSGSSPKPVSSAGGAAALVDELFAEPQPDREPEADPSLDYSMQLPEVTSHVAPPPSAIHVRQPLVISPPPEQAPVQPQPTPEPDPSIFAAPRAAPSSAGAPAAAPALQQPQPRAPLAAQSDDQASETGVRLPRPSFAASNAVGPVATAGGNSALKRLLLPGVAAAAVAGIMIAGWQYAEHTASVAKTSTAFVDPDQLRQERAASAELQDLQREKREAPPPPVIPPPAVPPPEDVVTPPPEPPPPTQVADAKPVPRRAASGPAAPAAPASPWDAYYGGRDNFNTPTSSTTTAAAKTTTAAPTTAGLRIPVRLDGAIASSPPGPVIALVTQTTTFGDITLPVGTQIHGQTGGTSGPRVLVNFSFALVDGRQVPLRGIAMSADKRPGIPGSRSLGGASDVAAGGAEGAVRGIVEGAANIVGDNPGGDAIRGTAGAMGGKASRLNNEEEVVTTQRGARFVVYVGG